MIYVRKNNDDRLTFLRNTSWFILFIILLISFSGAGSTAKANAAADPLVFVDGERLTMDTAPFISQGTTLAPMRPVFEAFGAELEWDHITKTVTAIKNDTVIQYTIGEQMVYLNGQALNFAAQSGRIVNGRTMVPLRMISETLGADVHYESSTRNIFIFRTEGHPLAGSLLHRYRLHRPYHTLLQHAPSFISYARENHHENSYLFFGDSLTWGGYLGRMEALPMQFQNAMTAKTAATEKAVQAWNWGVPGFNHQHLAQFIPYVMEHLPSSNAVIQLQYFWSESANYTGLPELLGEQIPDDRQGRQYLIDRLAQDVDVEIDRPAPYYARTAAERTERTERGRSLFEDGGSLTESYENSLIALRDWMEARPEQSFYIYMPPYLMEEVFQSTRLTAQQYEQKLDEIESIFSGLSHVYFYDFNTLGDTWNGEHFIDWWHRTPEGEMLLAEELAEWIDSN